MKLPPVDTRLVEVRHGLLASQISRAHEGLVDTLSLATSLIDLIKPNRDVGNEVEAIVRLEAANALWDQGEMMSSIGMLRDLDNPSVLGNQTLPVKRSNLLVKIAHQVALARLEQPGQILTSYLKPALSALKGAADGAEAGEVFHQFAMFCDQQLQDPDGLADLERLQALTQNKAIEVADLEKLIRDRSKNTQEKQRAALHSLSKAKTWLKLDQAELRRHLESRDEFLTQSLENYLLALSASDSHDTDSLRFTAMWLERSDLPLANHAVSKHISAVPSRKFASLMNQLASRLLNNTDLFQQLLSTLILKICSQHPYHGMHQIYAGVNGRVTEQDDVAISRKRATKKVVEAFRQSRSTGVIWDNLKIVNDQYVRLAVEKADQYKQDRKIPFKHSIAATKLNSLIAAHAVPPSTMHLDLVADMDYSLVPKMAYFEPQMSIASGVSAPKIITAIGTNGQKYRQLVSVSIFPNLNKC